MVFQDDNKLKVAVPNKGRLREPTIELLRQSGYQFRVANKALYASSTNSDLVFVFVRADDIPVLVGSGVIDIGITGQDLVQERGAKIEELLTLGFGNCRLCVAVEESLQFSSLKDLQGKTIATSFPAITQHHFSKEGVEVHCVEMNGSIEIMVPLKLADAIVDLVETGDTLKKNHLKVAETLGQYQSVLICHPSKVDDPRVLKVKRRMEGVLVANQYAVLEYNINKSKLADAEKVAPGFNSPTVSALEDAGMVAVKVMVEKKAVVDVMDRLEALGATAIFETGIRNCRL